MVEPGALFWAEQSAQIKSDTFEVIGASVVGASHQVVGQPCQDVFATETGLHWAIAVVSDGAGSAPRALEGAQIISEEICAALVSCVATTGGPREQSAQDSCWLTSSVVNGIERARERCLSLAREGERLRSFHATIVGSVLINDRGILFQIGDGGASAHKLTADGIDTVGFSPPENGEYANETFFFTEDAWREHLRITEIQHPVDAVWLMTDGAYQLMVPRQEMQLRSTTVQEIDRLVLNAIPSNRSEVLATILSSPQAAQRNDDDKTLVIIQRRLRNEQSS